ncbi:FAD-binding protein [Subsaximicrobium wynnwilliamsii]|uniref:FAD-binding protein n=1 Tax=Subsaximicrobium wynnwilliamsii TaxID=291179 RepID=A0A5C6ZHR8_9FLAO|nr:D-arabinono-1,4-lactone oxidase [Subsaximicrobium wynnwilliamsii]TXD84078.1 FAD-binding protein [Subsaximicrobium wynnwilliamsii]TXD88964.1 FAD-binding protein [Subsaximicrobium wynnwilliamsii]TXE03790.1 FAD-binding protein [Subsaximicrobium wynnwilliamsii]
MNNEKIWKSWNENIQHSYKKLHTITSEKELQQIIIASENIKIFGNKQSSADISAGADTLIDMRAYDKMLSIDKKNMRITVESGMRLSTLLEKLEDLGWCIPCLPDINTITVGGALATGTHGTSGSILAQYMCACHVVLADGTIEEVTEKDPLMDALRVAIGMLGVISEVTFQCQPSYQLHLKEGPEKDEQWLSEIKTNLKKHDFLRILWLPHTGSGYVIKGDKIDAATPVQTKLGPKYLKHRRTVSKFLYQYSHRFAWTTALANKILYRLFFSSKKEHKGSLYQATVTKSRGSTLELAEWTVALDRFPQVFAEIKSELNAWSNKSFVHIPMDVRFIKKDQSWLSYAYGQDTVTMGCVSRNAATADTYEAFETVERIFLKHGGRPHWGKRFQAKDAQLSKLYPKWEDFKILRKQMDPSNKFLNAYTTALLNENPEDYKTQRVAI